MLSTKSSIVANDDRLWCYECFRVTGLNFQRQSLEQNAHRPTKCSICMDHYQVCAWHLGALQLRFFWKSGPLWQKASVINSNWSPSLVQGAKSSVCGFTRVQIPFNKESLSPRGRQQCLGTSFRYRDWCMYQSSANRWRIGLQKVLPWSSYKWLPFDH